MGDEGIPYLVDEGIPYMGERICNDFVGEPYCDPIKKLLVRKVIGSRSGEIPQIIY